MRIDIIGLKPDREGECYLKGNRYHVDAAVKILPRGGGDFIPLEPIDEQISTSENVFTKDVAEAIAWLADKTDTELFGITVALVPKRTEDALWADPVTFEEVDEPRRSDTQIEEEAKDE